MLGIAPRHRSATSRLAAVFNLQGSEMIFLVLIALLVLGPEKLPDAIRKFGRVYAEFRKMANGFQGELRSALDEPMREIQKTADMVRSAANFDAAPSSPASTTVPAPAAATPPTTQTAPTSATSPETPSDGGDPSTGAAPARPGLNFGNPAARRQIDPAVPDVPSPDMSAPEEGSPT